MASLFVWKVVACRIPTADALEARGIQVQNNTCVLCEQDVESADHILLNCRVAEEVWHRLSLWMNIPPGLNQSTVDEMLQSVNGLNVSKNRKRIIHAIYIITMWSIWKARNRKIFEGIIVNRYKLVEDIKEMTFDCVVNRSKFKDISWGNWCNFNLQL
ncbi:uncharacterized protein LOC110931740 [Helianthus annuus]|uniref:uncharacterized protein LOC110931740 n=1 Tax=Helianthus annuus TaxID=4232 RepID=UPI000B8FD6A1|nr:uncharacterized protein LOC110931740 [Helianthus annuus]